MTIHITVETCQGVTSEVRAFAREETALALERRWLAAQGITSETARQGKADNGTELLLFAVELEE